MPQRQDYVERMLEELRQSLAEVERYLEAGSPDAALLILLQAQERLFVRPAQDFMTRPVAEQVHLLALGEPADHARDKCLTYATLLTEAGRTYRAKRQPELAQGAYGLALHVSLLAARQFPPAESTDLRAQIAALCELVPAEERAPELRELLRQVEGHD